MKQFYKFLLSFVFLVIFLPNAQTQCSITSLTVSSSDLNNDTYLLTIDLTVDNPSNTSFDLFINEIFNSFQSLDDLPLSIVVDCSDEENDLISVCINDDPNCCAEAILFSPCEGPISDCYIDDVEATVYNCNNDAFEAVINFTYDGVGDNGFMIVGNGNNYGTFSYDELPIVISDLDADCDLEYEFVVIDNSVDSCLNFIDLGVVCCGDSTACELTELLLETDYLGNDVYNLIIDLEYDNPGNTYFDILINEIYHSSHLFGDLPLDIHIDCSGLENDLVTICVNDLPGCCVEDIVFNPCEEPISDCYIADVEAMVDNCNDGVFDAVINFTYDGVGDDGFSIAGNGTNYGTFSYDELPIVISGLDADCDLEYEFVVIDNSVDSCLNFVELGLVCCADTSACALTELQLETDYLGNNEYNLIIDLVYTNPGNEYFDLYINEVFHSYHLFSDLPLDVHIDCSGFENDLVTICVNDVPECCIEAVLFDPCEEPISDCYIDDVEATVDNCNDGIFDAVINFTYDGVGDGFTIVGNGNNYGTFSYDELPIVISNLDADCDLEYEFVVIDNSVDSCLNFVELGPVCCIDSFIYNISYLLINNDGMIEIVVSYENQTADCQSAVSFNGQDIIIVDGVTSNISLGEIECGIQEDLTITFVDFCNPQIFYDLIIPASEFACVVDVDDIYDNSIITYYNSENQSLVIKNELSHITIEDVILYNALGQEVLNSANSNEISLNGLVSGVFFVNIQLSNGHFLTRKIIKNR